MGEVAKYRNGKAHENCIDESGKYIVVNSKFVSTNGTVIKHSNMQNEPLAQNEIAFVLSDVPNGRAIARTFLVEENDKYTLNQRIAGITSSENTYPYFLHILMNRHPYFLAFDDGVKQTNLSVSDVLNFETYYPEYEEQKQIGEYFRNLDRLITLHQREFAFLCKEKSKKFRYIKNAWEQRKVGDLLIERNQQAPMSDEYPLMAFIANEGVAPKGDRYDRSALVTDTANKLYKKTEIGDFIYSSNNLETGSIGLNKYGKACISPVYSIFEPTGIADSDFLGRRLVRKDFINAMVKWRQGVIYGQWRIHESDFLKIEIPVPSVVEQRKIGAYLDQLDRLITLHQRKPNFYTGGYYAE